MPDPPSLKSAGIPWLRGEPRQCGLKAPGYVAFGWSRGSAGIVRIANLDRGLSVIRDPVRQQPGVTPQ